MKRTGNDNKIDIVLASDNNGSVLQVASYDTTSYLNIPSGGNYTYTKNTIIRIVAMGADAWISIGTDEGTGAGLLVMNGTEITLLVIAGNTLYVNDAMVNVVELSE